MSDIYVEYQATGKQSVWRITVKVPRTKIDQYREANGDDASNDNDIARKLSEESAARTLQFAQLGVFGSGVSFPEDLSPSLKGRTPVSEIDGMTFWSEP
jgi:hypothetical protein